MSADENDREDPRPPRFSILYLGCLIIPQPRQGPDGRWISAGLIIKANRRQVHTTEELCATETDAVAAFYLYAQEVAEGRDPRNGRQDGDPENGPLPAG